MPTPRLMPAPAAAIYIGVSESTLRTLRIRRRELLSKRMYDRYDLDAYVDALPYEGEGDKGANSCDEAFGVEPCG